MKTRKVDGLLVVLVVLALMTWGLYQVQADNRQIRSLQTQVRTLTQDRNEWEDTARNQ